MCRCVWGGGGGYWSLTLCMHCSSFDLVFVFLESAYVYIRDRGVGEGVTLSF